MSITFSSAKDLFDYLDNLNFFHMNLSLGRMERTLDALGLANPPFKVVQVAGTNGKGSTSSFLASLLKTYGMKTGLFTSPHFVYPSERIQINGRRIPEEEWLAAAQSALAICSDLTYFELLTVVALQLFKDKGVDIAVLEAGLGAQYDATTTVRADAVCFAPIALDHTKILGSTLEAIATDKSFAIRSKAPVASAIQFPEASKVLQARAKIFNAPYEEASPLGKDVELGLKGEHQRYNAAAALLCFRNLLPMLQLKEDEEKTRKGLASAFIPGRLQEIKESEDGSYPAMLLDGAHNPHGMRSLTAYIRASGFMPKAIVFSCLKDKDWSPSFGMLLGNMPGIPLFLPKLDNERAQEPQEPLAKVPAGTRATACQNVREALELAKKEKGKEPILVTGSLYLLSDVFALYPQLLERA